MKLNISHDNQQINNYINLPLVQENIDVSKLIDNSCEEILLSNTLDYISYDKIPNIILQLFKKLRLNGRFILVGIEGKVLSKLFLSDNISCEDYNKIIRDVKSLNVLNNIRNILVSLGLEIETEVIKGHRYEIVATRRSI